MSNFYTAKSEMDLRLMVANTFFPTHKVSVEDSRIDFLVYSQDGNVFAETFLWAESKFAPAEINTMFAQLILTIKKKIDAGDLPPKYIGVFDKEKIAFVEFHRILPIFNLNDFNWNETPSSISKKTENIVAKYLTIGVRPTDRGATQPTPAPFKGGEYTTSRVVGTTFGENSPPLEGAGGGSRWQPQESQLQAQSVVITFNFAKDAEELKEFIAQNFAEGRPGTNKAQINRNNFVIIYNKWVAEVAPYILADFSYLKKYGINDCEFYLADLLSLNNKTITDQLNIVLQSDHYESKVKIDERLFYEKFEFKDKGAAHSRFWAKYERPPKEEYHEYILYRHDLLVPQNVRERKGAFFTPKIWVEKSQEYLEKVFGVNWQDEYYVWDCCAGTCNLLFGLTNKYRVWASTLDQPDVDIVHKLIDDNSFNLLKSHVFRFDFLNDSFDKLPQGLQDIINDPDKQKKLIIYINPPYAEATSTATAAGTGHNKENVATVYKTRDQYKSVIGAATNEIYAQFMARVYCEMPECKLSLFSKLKFVNSQNFIQFRTFFKAEYKDGFIVRADSFDNVKGKFPIGFTIWDLRGEKFPASISLDIAGRLGKKKYWALSGKSINQWIIQFNRTITDGIAYMANPAPDFQHINQPYLTSEKGTRHFHYYVFNKKNIIEGCIYFAVRLCIEPTWLNDRDQFLYPNDGWQKDTDFQNDCLVFALFHSQNRICSQDGVNHWLPFTAREVDAKDNFSSEFMADYLKSVGACIFPIEHTAQQPPPAPSNGGEYTMSRMVGTMFGKNSPPLEGAGGGGYYSQALPSRAAVLEAGKAMWHYYHAAIKFDDKALVDAGLYEIREYFKGRGEGGKMHSRSTDEQFNTLDKNLKDALKALATHIQPKVYEYGFLRE
jgi:hypothetical protein